MMRRITSLTLSVVLLSSVPAWAAEEKSAALTDPVEILKKMDAAAKAVSAVSYDVEFNATGDAVKFVAQGKGTYLVQGWAGRHMEHFYAKVEVRGPGSEESQKLAAGSDGENYFLVDFAAKTAYEDIDPGVMGKRVSLVLAGLMPEFVHPEPFSDEINGKTHTLKESEKAGGEDCYVVFVEYKNTPGKATWYVSKTDFLPRRRIDHINIPSMGAGDMIRTITRLTVDPKLDKDAFKLKLPEGFKKTDDFAP